MVKESDEALGDFKGVQGHELFLARLKIPDKQNPKEKEWYLEKDKVDALEAH